MQNDDLIALRLRLTALIEEARALGAAARGQAEAVRRNRVLLVEEERRSRALLSNRRADPSAD
jgi:hypothetical protein